MCDFFVISLDIAKKSYYNIYYIMLRNYQQHTIFIHTFMEVMKWAEFTTSLQVLRCSLLRSSKELLPK